MKIYSKMVCCAVSSCKNTSAKISKDKDGITFHKFPQDKDRKHQWEVAINREKWAATESSAVCSEHFVTEDFYLTVGGLRRLSVNAVPMINISACQETEPTISKAPPIDVKPTDSEEVVELKFKVKRLEEIAGNRKRRLHLMWQRHKRLGKELIKMKIIIKHLIKNKHYIEPR